LRNFILTVSQAATGVAKTIDGVATGGTVLAIHGFFSRLANTAKEAFEELLWRKSRKEDQASQSGLTSGR
jgi:hypothetical protein